MTEIVLVAAVADNGVIGADNAIPWRQKSDMQRFCRHGIALSAPITPLSATAATSTISVMMRPSPAKRAPAP